MPQLLAKQYCNWYRLCVIIQAWTVKNEELSVYKTQFQHAAIFHKTKKLLIPLRLTDIQNCRLSSSFIQIFKSIQTKFFPQFPWFCHWNLKRFTPRHWQTMLTRPTCTCLRKYSGNISIYLVYCCIRAPDKTLVQLVRD